MISHLHTANHGTGVILALLDSDALAHNVGWLIALLLHTSYQALSECLILHLINFEAFLRQALLGASEGKAANSQNSSKLFADSRRRVLHF